MARTPPWSTASEKEFDNAREAMEKLVMNRLYPFTFSPALAREGRWPVQTDDLERDEVLIQKMRLFEWVEEKHLDLPVGEHSKGFIDFGVAELLKINHYKAPRDKLICILNCSKVVFGLIRHLGKGEDADTFLPILIFIVLRARPEHLISNVEYINRFRSPERLSSESGYYLSSLMGAISFIEQMEYSSFSNLSREDFERNVERSATKLAEETQEEDKRRQRALSSDGGHGGSSSEEEARSIGIAPVAAALADDTRAFLQRTGEAARLGVSRPIGAIGRFLSEASEGVRTPSSSAHGTTGHDGGTETPPPPRGQSSAELPPGTPRARLFGMLGDGGSPSGNSTPNTSRQPSAALNFGSWGRGGGDESGSFATPAHGPAAMPPHAPRAQRLASGFADPNRYPGQRPGDDDGEDDLLSPSQQRRIGPQDYASPDASINEIADMSAEVDRVHHEQLEAAVETLKGIFPETEHDVCLMVLESW